MSDAFVKLPVGDSAVSITQLGFGCARLFSGSELRASTRLVETALASGIQHFDTAPTYSWGQSEEVLGVVLEGVRGVTVATKVGLMSPQGAPHPLASVYRQAVRPLLAGTPGLKAALLRLAGRTGQRKRPRPPLRHLLPSEINKSLDESLARLRRDRVDMLLIHEPEDLIIGEDVVEVLTRLRSEGVIGAFGLAWGDYPSGGHVLGQVDQHRFRDDFQIDSAHKGVIMILHGIMRGMDRQKTLRPPERVAEVCARLPACAVLFSASSPSQVRDVAAAVKDRLAVSRPSRAGCADSQ